MSRAVRPAMRSQPEIDVLVVGGGAVGADHDHGVEVMGSGAVFLALGGRELNGWHRRIID
jgi:hypothetical protein